jgi:uncharacterized protein
MAINWVVKVSKLCNMRCRYCYEWEELSNRARMSFELWERLLHSARDYHDRQEARLGRTLETRIIWHGGEPALLPLSYFEKVLELQSRILGESRLRRGEFLNVLQTNLYSLPDEKLELFARSGIQLGISLDLIGGVRLDVGGNETEERVVANMDRLRERGVRFGAITVLAGHTHRRIVAIYNFYESLGVDFRLLPLFDAPLNTPEAPFALTAGQAARALCRLFRHWIRRPNRILVRPLLEYTHAVYDKLTGRTAPRYDRRVLELTLLVNTDGSVYQVRDAYEPELAHGNLHEEPFLSMAASPRYEASLQRDEQLIQRHCAPCRFRGACTSLPLFDSKRSDAPAERCAIAYDVMAFIEDYFRVNKITPAQIRGFLA